jgi:hypothetical protein
MHHIIISVDSMPTSSAAASVVIVATLPAAYILFSLLQSSRQCTVRRNFFQRDANAESYSVKQGEPVKLRYHSRNEHAAMRALGSSAYKHLHQLCTAAITSQCPGPTKLSIWHRMPPTPNKSPLNLSGSVFIAAGGREDGYRRNTGALQHPKKEPVFRSLPTTTEGSH